MTGQDRTWLGRTSSPICPGRKLISRAGQDRTGQDREGRKLISRAGQGRTGQDREGQGRTGKDREGRKLIEEQKKIHTRSRHFRTTRTIHRAA